MTVAAVSEAMPAERMELPGAKICKVRQPGKGVLRAPLYTLRCSHCELPFGAACHCPSTNLLLCCTTCPSLFSPLPLLPALLATHIYAGADVGEGGDGVLLGGGGHRNGLWVGGGRLGAGVGTVLVPGRCHL